MTTIIHPTTETETKACRPWYQPVAIDTETYGCNPKKESPVGRAKLFCMTMAWSYDPETKRPRYAAFIERHLVPFFQSWLEDPNIPKVGSNIFGYDYHVFSNMGITLRGIVGDTQRMSQLLNPSKTFGHGLKPWGERLGYETTTLDSFSQRVVGGKIQTYKRDRVVKKGAWPVHYFEGARHRVVSWGSRKTVCAPALWKYYPGRREAFKKYAVQDACMSLSTYYELRQRLTDCEW